MLCPRCNKTLTSTEICGTEVDQCPTCRGIWFDRHELQTLLELSPADLRPIGGGKLRDDVNRRRAMCPRDQAELIRVRSALHIDVVVDSCPRCGGIWLDGGELDRLLS